MKGFRVTKMVKEIKFEGVWGRVRSKKCFQRQPFTIYLRLTLVFMWNSIVGNGLISVFQEFFASIKKMLILAGRLGTRLSFYGV